MTNGEIIKSDSNGPKNTLIPQQMLEQILQNQVKELELKGTELELKNSELALQKQQDNNSFDFAKASLAATERDRQDARKCDRDKMKDRYKLIGAISMGLILLVCLAVFKDKDELAMEIIKAIGYIFAGAMGGYAAGRLKSGADAKQQSDQEA